MIFKEYTFDIDFVALALGGTENFPNFSIVDHKIVTGPSNTWTFT